MEPIYLSIRQKETGSRIKSLLRESGYTVRDIQNAMGFENPQAVYKWISGKCLPSLDNFLILSRLLNTSIEDILVIDGDIPRFRIILNYTQRWQEKSPPAPLTLYVQTDKILISMFLGVSYFCISKRKGEIK